MTIRERFIISTRFGENKTTNCRFRISFNSKKLCSDLTRLGAVRNKSLILTFPKFITDELMPSFILGYFDGDGCV